MIWIIKLVAGDRMMMTQTNFGEIVPRYEHKKEK